jgi:hypothetical protein
LREFMPMSDLFVLTARLRRQLPRDGDALGLAIGHGRWSGCPV